MRSLVFTCVILCLGTIAVAAVPDSGPATPVIKAELAAPATTSPFLDQLSEFLSHTKGTISLSETPLLPRTYWYPTQVLCPVPCITGGCEAVGDTRASSCQLTPTVLFTCPPGKTIHTQFCGICRQLTGETCAQGYSYH